MIPLARMVILCLMITMLGQTGARAESVNTISLVNQPQVGGEAIFAIHLGQHYSNPKAALFCYQSTLVYGRERLFVDKYSKVFDGAVIFTPLSDGRWDPAQSATCAAVLFQEPASAKRPEFTISEWIEFGVIP